MGGKGKRSADALKVQKRTEKIESRLTKGYIQESTAGDGPATPWNDWQFNDPASVWFSDVEWTPGVFADGKGKGIKEVLRHVNWNVSNGEKVGLIGANGSGKSVQLQMIRGNVFPSNGKVFKRPFRMNIGFMQQEANLDNRHTAYQELLAVFNDRPLWAIDEDLERSASGDDMEELDSLVTERELAREHLEAVERIIPQLGLQSRRDTPIFELSGGWQMRIGLGRIILDSPDLVLLDEPTNHVDLETVEFMEAFLQSQDIPMVIVSHDRYFLNRVCTKIVEIQRGRAKTYNGNYIDYLKQRDKAMAKEWRKYQLYLDRIISIEKAIEKMQARRNDGAVKAKKLELAAFKSKPVPKPEVSEFRDFSFPSVATEGDEAEGSDEEGPLLEVSDLQVSFGEKVVVNGVSFSLRRGEKVAIVGRNGCGKSTMVRAIVGDDLGPSGRVAGQVDLPESGTSYFPQRLAEAFNQMDQTVSDTLYYCCSVADIEEAGGFDAVLERLRLDGVASNQPVSTLSGGEKARVAFAQFFMSPCGLLVLDEPTNHLDIPTRELLEDALKEFDGGAMVVSHDRFFLREFATRVIEVTDDGRLRDFSSWDDYEKGAAPEQWQEATQAEVAFVRQDAVAAHIWAEKKLSRTRKREGNVGLRRLSAKAVEFKDEVEEASRRKDPRKAAAKRLIAMGTDPSLVREYLTDPADSKRS